MGVPGACHILADAIGVDSKHDLDTIFKTLSYLGIFSLPYEPQKQHQPLFAISVNDGSQVARVRFDQQFKQWSFASSHHADLASDVAIKKTPEVPDWTALLPSTPHVDFLKSRDWAATSLGPMLAWKSPLRLMTMKMLSDPRPANLYVGSDRVAIYNEPFSVVAASRHPFMMGATCEAALPATWPFLSQMFNDIERTGNAFSLGSFEMSVEKVAGFLEE